MKIHTSHIVLGVAMNKAFSYIADYANIPKWSINFILKLEKVGDEYMATTPVGKMKYEIVAEKSTGVIDLVLDHKPLPTRVVSLGPDTTLYLFTLILPSEIPDQEFQRGIKGLEEELELLKEQVEK